LKTTVIKAEGSWRSLGLREAWEYRELLFFLTWRDVKVKYKQTHLGVAWAVLQPLLTMVVFSVVFGRVAKLPSHGVPYPLFTFSALLPWQLFANAMVQSSNSLVTNQALLTKVYFPRMLIPAATVLAGVVDFSVAVIVLFAMMLYYGVYPTGRVLMLPVFVLLAVGAALAVGVWLSALNVRYRDVRYTVPFLTQLWLFASPIAYSSSVIPEQYRLLYSLNPMVGVVDGFRWALLDVGPAPTWSLLGGAVMILLLLVTGLLFFRRTETIFADVV
jgi:homopolymeric O-antigen transport system permease protein